MREQKEFEQLKKAIVSWHEANNGNVSLVCSLVSFDRQSGGVKDDAIFGYGYKEAVKVQLRELTKLLKEEKEDFVNW